jgi:hypothetical protein
MGAAYVATLIGIGEYVTQCANFHNKGLYNAIVYASMMVAMIIGSIVSALVLGNSSI